MMIACDHYYNFYRVNGGKWKEYAERGTQFYLSFMHSINRPVEDGKAWLVSYTFILTALYSNWKKFCVLVWEHYICQSNTFHTKKKPTEQRSPNQEEIERKMYSSILDLANMYKIHTYTELGNGDAVYLVSLVSCAMYASAHPRTCSGINRVNN